MGKSVRRTGGPARPYEAGGGDVQLSPLCVESVVNTVHVNYGGHIRCLSQVCYTLERRGSCCVTYTAVVCMRILLFKQTSGIIVLLKVR
jgi:hypothetical protein